MSEHKLKLPDKNSEAKSKMNVCTLQKDNECVLVLTQHFNYLFKI